jgi:hypothetical protein
MAWAMHSTKVVLLTLNKCALSKIPEKQISNVYELIKILKKTNLDSISSHPVVSFFNLSLRESRKKMSLMG